MQQMCRYIVVFIFLIICSVQDIKRKKISVTVIVLFAILGIGIDIWQHACQRDFFPGIILAGSMLLFSGLSHEQLGLGDGLVLLVLSLLLTGKELIQVFLTALFAAAGVSGILLALKRAGRRSTLAFVPFMAAAFLLQRLVCER